MGSASQQNKLFQRYEALLQKTSMLVTGADGNIVDANSQTATFTFHGSTMLQSDGCTKNQSITISLLQSGSFERFFGARAPKIINSQIFK